MGITGMGVTDDDTNGIDDCRRRMGRSNGGRVDRSGGLDEEAAVALAGDDQLSAKLERK